MPTYNQLGGLAIVGGDIPFKNYSGADIPAGTGVLFDGTNKGTAHELAGVVVPTTAGGVAKTAGITLETIKAGSSGRVRVLGGAVATANATINPGDLVQLSDVSTHEGKVIIAASTNEILGKAMSEAAAGDPVLVWVNPTAHN